MWEGPGSTNRLSSQRIPKELFRHNRLKDASSVVGKAVRAVVRVHGHYYVDHIPSRRMGAEGEREDCAHAILQRLNVMLHACGLHVNKFEPGAVGVPAWLPYLAEF